MRRAPAHIVNGIVVSIGVGLAHGLFGAFAGRHAAQMAIVGAVCASLADLPNTVDRTWNRVLAAGLLGSICAAMVMLLEPHPFALAAGIAGIAFVGLMAMAWGPRAGPISFAPVLALVFAMGMPPEARSSAAATAGFALGGALLYLAWSAIASTMLQPLYRRRALSEALGATAHLLRARAAMLRGEGSDEIGASALRALVADEAVLAERLQLARDLLFPAPDTARNRGETAMLLHAIDLRDVLLASRLDLDRLGSDAVALALRARVADALGAMADRLDATAHLLGGAPRPQAVPPGEWTPERHFAGIGIPAADPRGRLVPALVERLGHLHEDVVAIDALQRGAEARLPVAREALRAFVAPEGWPIATLREHLAPRSPVMRHAIRTGLALGSAYLLALALPWAAHPQWLVLGVAVVLRGSLDQTLARRRPRLVGTVIGCLLVLGFANLQSPALMTAIFLVATGVAHAFALRRYLITAVAATLMALLQAHLADPAAGFAIAERLADTVLGAALAWGFSFVLPSWERRSLEPAVRRAMQALREYAEWALSIELGANVSQRLARRKAYDALGALGAALQRSAAEPERVRPPVDELSAFLDGGQRLMAHLSAVRLMLARRSAVLENPEAAGALRAARAELARLLTEAGGAQPPLPQYGLADLPLQPPGRDLLPWLQRRLGVAIDEAHEVRGEAHRLLARLAAANPQAKDFAR
ncbi:FUSC family membrane protein [Quisquiliibacterium transsilvanicum]